MKKLIPIFLILILCLLKDRQCVAQDYAPKDYYLVDSLDLDALTQSDKEIIETSLKEFHASSDDTSKVNALKNICENMMHEDWRKYQVFQFNIILYSLKTTSDKKTKIKLQKEYSYALNNLGFIETDKGNIKKALEHYLMSLKIKEELNDKIGLGQSYNSLGILYFNQGNTSKALEYLFKSLKIRLKYAAKDEIANIYSNIGSVYDQKGDLEFAIENYNKSLKLKEELGDTHGIAHIYNNLSMIYSLKDENNKALSYLNQSYNCFEKVGDKFGMSEVLNNIGAVYNKVDKIDSAFYYFDKSLKLREVLGVIRGISQSYCNIGRIMFNKGDLNEAYFYAMNSYKLASDIGYVNILEKNTELLSKIFEKQGDYKKAMEMYKLHIQMRDSLHNEETQKAAAKQQAQYEYEKQKAIDDKEHEKQLVIEQEAKEKQQVITYATAGGLGLVGIFLIFVFNRLQVTKRQKNTIEEQKQEVETQKAVVEQAHHELEEKNQEILDSINYAKRIQNAILPPQKVVKEYLQESFILYKPKDIVAGDFYWLEHKEDKVMFAACDCTGHGVPGAMVSVVCNNGLNRSVREYNLTEPGKILDKTREIVIQEFEKSEEEVKDGMDIALCTLQGNTLHYAGANNPLWIIRKGAEEIEEIKADKQPIGKYAEPTPYTTHQIELQKGDTIYIFSDGYADQFGGEKGKKFKAANFKKLLLSIQNETIEQQKEIINQAFEEWKGDLEQLDDVCVIGARI